MADSDSRRHIHYNHQRSSLRSDRSSRPTTRDGPTAYRGRSAYSPSLGESCASEEYDNLDGVAAPSPVVRTSRGSSVWSQRPSSPLSFKEKERLRRSRALQVGHGASSTRTAADDFVPSAFENLDEIAAPSPIEDRVDRRWSLTDERLRIQEERQSSRERRLEEYETTALPQLSAAKTAHPLSSRAEDVATGIYTASYLVFFSILGTLARLGLQWLTFYPGTPSIFPVLWANFAGTLLMGYFSEDQRLFREGQGTSVNKKDIQLSHNHSTAEARHSKAKKAIPLYIGLTTGFCGSLTSFSSFMRDVFFALSNDMPSPLNHPYRETAPSAASTVSRNGGYSFMAILAVIIITISVCYSALQLGAHLSLYTERITQTIPFRFLRRIIDPTFVLLGLGMWLGAVFMSIWPPDRPGGPQSRASWADETWRGQALFACVFAPVGCLMRFYVSLKLNSIATSFPYGTFVVNIFGTAVLGMAFDLQHVRLAGTGVGGGRIGCQVLQGIMDGFCGALTTVSTWILELNALRRGHAYIYGGVSVLAGLGMLVVIMGSVRWSVGWQEVACPV